MDQCVDGTSATACGLGGNPCSSCTSGACAGGQCVCTPLIDDMESGTPNIPANCGRSGGWFAYNDGSAMQFPVATPKDGGANPFEPSMIPGGRGTSHYAAHTYGGPFTTYVGMGVTIGGPPNFSNGPYNAVAQGYTGITFYAMVGITQPGATTFIAVRITDKYSDPSSTLCNSGPNPPAGTSCFDDATTALTLSPTWTQVTIPFSILRKQGTGPTGSLTLDATSIYTIDFEVSSSARIAGPYSADIWIDDIAFTP
jgi:hypothetical protein